MNKDDRSKCALELGKIIECQQKKGKALDRRAIASKGPSMLADRNRTKVPGFRKSDVDPNNGG